MSARSVGVEEEFLLVDRETGRVRGSAPAVLPRLAELDRGEAEPELTREQVEVSTPVVSSLGELRAELTRLRRLVVDRAAEVGVAVLASGTSPYPGEGQTTDKRRYRTMMERYGPVGRVQLTCGCHVHVGVASQEEAVAVLDRIRGWLPVLRALTANSPFWRGQDTSYASYRTQVWGRWPSAGPVAGFGSARAYDDAVSALVNSGVLVDDGMVYFDARVSRRYPTVEIRVADVCQTVDETVAFAGLCRALVATAAAEWALGGEPPPIRTELLRGASWRASRWGIAGERRRRGGAACPRTRPGRAAAEARRGGAGRGGGRGGTQAGRGPVAARGRRSSAASRLRRAGRALRRGQAGDAALRAAPWRLGLALMADLGGRRRVRRHSPVTSQRVSSTTRSGSPRCPSASSTTTSAPGMWAPSQAP